MSVQKIRQLRCVKCSAVYAYGEVEYTCPTCGIAGILDVEFDYDAIAAGGFGPAALKARTEQSIWRYFELLPIERRESTPNLQLGMTPVYRFPELGREIGIAELLIKDEGRLPTGSLKDRASAIGVARASELGYREITCASTGNAASSRLSSVAILFSSSATLALLIASALILSITIRWSQITNAAAYSKRSIAYSAKFPRSDIYSKLPATKAAGTSNGACGPARAAEGIQHYGPHSA